MSRWIGLGIASGVKTTNYPRHPSAATGSASAIAARLGQLDSSQALAAAELCPTSALKAQGNLDSGSIEFDAGKCVMCGRCTRTYPEAFKLVRRPEVAVVSRSQLTSRASWAQGATQVQKDVARLVETVRDRSQRVFAHSLHIRHVDAGSCNGCESELQMLSTPHYDLSRLGFFFTPTPRHADALLVTGVVTRQMEGALLRTYEAMPHPKVVIAAGVCAVGGGCFTGSAMNRGPLDRVLPVDVYVPGCPPTPLALLHGLLLAVGRAEIRYLGGEGGDGD